MLRPGPICAFIGEPGAGKSNVLFAAPRPARSRLRPLVGGHHVGRARLSIEATLADGRTISLHRPRRAPPIVHFPAALRGGRLLAGTPEGAARAIHRSIRHALERAPAPRVALVRGLEACATEAEGVVFAIEEPELFLSPQAHRYLYRLVHRLAERGNQVFFTTHAPGLLNVAALEEVNLVTRDELGVTAVERLHPIDVDDTFRVMCEFDAERAELFFSRAAILVEGMTEKMAFPFVFPALGHDADREQISIVECGGKSNLPLFVEICRRARIPYVVVHDSDMRPGPAARRVGREAQRPDPPSRRRPSHGRPRPGLRRRRRLPRPPGQQAGAGLAPARAARTPTSCPSRSCAPSGSRSPRRGRGRPRTADRASAERRDEARLGGGRSSRSKCSAA